MSNESAGGAAQAVAKTTRDVIADYRYLRATLNAIVQPDRELSIEELVDSALNYDTMHGDTVMVILNALERRVEAAERERDAIAEELRRLNAEWKERKAPQVIVADADAVALARQLCEALVALADEAWPPDAREDVNFAPEEGATMAGPIRGELILDAMAAIAAFRAAYPENTEAKQ